MESSKPFADRTREQNGPATTNTSNDVHGTVNSVQDTVSGQAWKPKFDRRQSWSDQDHKHELQERLLNVEEGRETGFSETDPGH